MTKHVKLLALILSVVMLVGAFMTACKTKPEPSVTPQQTEGESNVESSTDKSTEKESSVESGENNTEACETDYTEILDYEGKRRAQFKKRSHRRRAVRPVLLGCRYFGSIKGI